jgi:sporulation protein YlmC with PRC-barrel domain
VKEVWMNTKELFDKEVLDVNANKVGKVVDMDFDMQQGVINHIVVKAGLTKKYAITLDKIDRIGDKIILKIGQDELSRKS